MESAVVRGALRQAAERLGKTEEAPGLVAQALMAHVLGAGRAQVLAHPERQLTAEQAERFEALVGRAAQGEPLAYLVGKREFFGLSFWVDRHVLVPRPETERLVELAIAARPGRILDVGTGSGCIAVTLAAHLPRARVTAVDISQDALGVARRNAERHGVAERITFVHSDLLSAWLRPMPNSDSGIPLPRSEPQFDLIAANLPYIDSQELNGLAVARHEPRMALDGGPGGLGLAARLLAEAPAVLAQGGRMLLEIGAGQGEAALALARQTWPRAQAAIVPDLAGLDRVLAVETGVQA